jgi:hypothetical protein
MHRFIATIAAAGLGLLAMPAIAADNGIYLGGSIGQGSVSFDDSFEGQNISYDASSTGFKLIAGWRFIDWLSVEANYVDLGSGDDTIAGQRFETDVTGATLSALGFVPIGPVDLFARAGFVNWNADIKAPGTGISGDDDGTDFTYGIGAQFRVWGLSLRAEYERFDVDSADTVDMLSLGVTYTFF